MMYQKDYRIKLENEDSFCINIKDFLFEFVRKFPIIIVFAIVCALGCGGIAFLTKEDTVAELSQEQIEEVNKYVVLEQKYNELRNSIINDVDENLAYYELIQYQVKCENELVRNDVMIALNNYIYTNGASADIANGNDKWKYDDLKYLITSTLEASANGLYSSVLRVNVYGTDENMCQELAYELDSKINEFLSSMQATVGNIECDIISKNILIDASFHISTMKSNLSSQINGIVKEMNSLKERFNDAQYQLLTGSAPTNNGIKTLVTQMILGAVAGVVLGFVFVAMVYLLNGKIKYDRELHERFGLRCFGQYDIKTRNRLKYILTRIENVVAGKDETIVICSENREESSVLVESLSQRCKNTKFVAVEEILTSESAMAIITNDTKVILLEKGHFSKLKDVRNKLAVCGENEVEVLGYIMYC